jgi:hypothetical protein
MPAPSPITTSVRVTVIAVLLWLAPIAAPVGAQPTTDFVPVTDAMLQDPAPPARPPGSSNSGPAPTPELHPSSGSNLFVFALPDRD